MDAQEQLTMAVKSKDHITIQNILQQSNLSSQEIWCNLFKICNENEIDEELMNMFLSINNLKLNQGDICNETILHVLVRNNHYKWIKKVLETKLDIDKEAKNNKGKTPLLVAAECGNLCVLKLLESFGGDIHFCDHGKNYAMHLATNNGHIEIIRYLVEEKMVDVDLKNEYGDTPLLKAAFKGYADCCRYLLSKGANVYHLNNDERSPLQTAAYFGRLKCVEAVMEHVIDKSYVNIRYSDGKTILHWASIGGNVDIVTYLLNAKAGKTAINSESGKGHNEVVRCLLDTKVNVDIRDSSDKTALIWAAIKGFADIVNSLISGNADVNVQDNVGETALHWASRKGYIDIVNCLLNAKANVNIQDSSGSTALLWAASMGHTDIVDLLIKAKADVNIQGHEERTAINWASKKGHDNTVKALLKANANINIPDKMGKPALSWAAGMGNENIVNYLINAGADINIQDVFAQTALMSVSKNGHSNVIYNLLKSKANVNHQDKRGNTALIWSAINGHAEILKSLINAEAIVDLTDDNGRTALNWAALRGHISCINELLKANACIDLSDNVGETPLMKASKAGYLDVVRFLLFAGANPTLRTYEDRTAYQLAETEAIKELFRDFCRYVNNQSQTELQL